MSAQPEVWLRGPVDGVPALLQPVAHALLQSLEDVERVLRDVPSSDLWRSPSGAATAGFHVLHMTGSLDRLFTYARGEALNEKQRAALQLEKSPPALKADVLLDGFRTTVQAALAQLRETDPATVTDARAVGRAGLPSTVLGLLFHGGEHTTRHTGQLITTLRIVRGGSAS